MCLFTACEKAGRIDAPAGLRGLLEAVEAGGSPLPPSPEDAERQRMGQGYAAANQARRNMVVLEDGYRRGGAGAADTDYPTRLGRPQMQAAAAQLMRLPLPDRSAPEIAALTAPWPSWRRAAAMVCPVAEGGVICTGLRYNPDRGRVIEGP